MPVPTVMTDLSATASSNSPAGTETMGTLADDYMRAAYAILRTTNHKGTNIPSAATTNIGTATGEFVDVTGTTTITSFGTVSAGITRTVRFTGALTITHNATTLILPGGVNITTVANSIGMFRSLGSGNWVCTGYLAADAVIANQNSYPPGHISGLLVTNNATDAVNDIDVSIGSAQGASKPMKLTAIMVKRLDAAWVQGTNQGGLDTGVKAASTCYHVFVIHKTADNAIDILMSTSATAPTMPTGWGDKRRIGSIRTDSGSSIIAIIPLELAGGSIEVRYVAQILDLSNVAQTVNTWTTRTLSLPTGIRVYAYGGAAGSGTGNLTFATRPTDGTDSATLADPTSVATLNATGASMGQYYGSGSDAELGTWREISDTSARIQTNSAGGASVWLTTKGWVDPRV